MFFLLIKGTKRPKIKPVHKKVRLVTFSTLLVDSSRTDKNLEHFLAALVQTIYRYHNTNNLSESWKDDVVKSYKNYYGIDLDIPRWNDLKKEYMSSKSRG